MLKIMDRLAACLIVVLALGLGAPANADIGSHQLKFAGANAKGHPQVMGMEKFAEIVKEKSGGKIVVTLFPGGVLGSDTETLSVLPDGAVQMLVLNAGILQSLAKPFASVDLPFLFDTAQQADAVMDGPFGQHLAALLPEKGLVSLGYWELGFRNLTNNVRAVNSVDDAKGLKIRIIQSPIMVDLFKSLGTNPVPLAYNELYAGLQSKIVDGQENPYANIVNAKFYEVQKYLTNTRHIYNPQIVLISKKFWDTLNADEQKLLQEAAVEARDYQRKVSREQDAENLKKLKDLGMQVSDLAPDQLAKFKAAVKPVVDKYANDIGEATMKELFAELAKAKK
jgi:tripartite ATP-independent transporter DctP family solute receptor